MFPENIIYIGVFLNLIGQVIYLKGIVKGKTKPNLISWFIWMAAPFIGVFFQLKAGAGLSVLPIFMGGFGPLLVIIFASFIKNAYWKITTFDIMCGIFSVVALVLYVLTHNLAISITFAILADGLAAVPTLIKSWKFPETETGSIYFFGIISNIFGLLIIKEWTFSIASFGIYLIALNILILFALYRKVILPSKVTS